MSDPHTRKGAEPFAKQFMDEAIVLKARKSIGNMIASTVEALAKDTKDLLDKNGASKTHVGAASEKFAVELIQLMAEAIKDIIPAMYPPSTQESPAPKQPKRPGQASSKGAKPRQRRK